MGLAMEWTIPRIGAEPLRLILSGGDRVFMVGANGSGKSSLIQQLISANSAENIVRISAHRQMWFKSGSIDMTPHNREILSSRHRDWERNYDARWRDDIRYGENKLSITIFDLIAKDNARAHAITRKIDEGKEKESVDRAKRLTPPFGQINELLARGMMGISLENKEGKEIRARRRDSETSFNMAQMSDGERNAAIIASTVLTAEEGDILLIDEPERHLHRSIIEPFLSALFDQRKDCAFVVSTHEIALPVANPEARVLMVRSCRWDGYMPQAWEIEDLEPGSGLPEDLKRAILGARKRILFVEGDTHSLDSTLYGVLFPSLSVVPLGSCREVLRSVKGLRETRSYHHTEAFGLIDRDDRTEDDVTDLAEQNVFALDVHSVEALYYSSDAIAAVARKQAELRGDDAEALIESAKECARETLRQQGIAERMAAYLCERRIRNDILSQIPTWKAIRDRRCEPIGSNADSLYSDELTKFKNLVDSDLDALIRRYPLRRSDIFNKIASSLKCRSRRDYESIVIAQARSDAEFSEKLKQHLGPLYRVLETMQE